MLRSGSVRHQRPSNSLARLESVWDPGLEGNQLIDGPSVLGYNPKVRLLSSDHRLIR